MLRIYAGNNVISFHNRPWPKGIRQRWLLPLWPIDFALVFGHGSLPSFGIPQGYAKGGMRSILLNRFERVGGVGEGKTEAYPSLAGPRREHGASIAKQSLKSFPFPHQ